MRLNKSLLVVAAHEDDAELSAGGTMMKLHKEGWKVYVIVTSDSGGGSRSTELAAKEGDAALKVLKTEPPIIFNYPDKEVPFNLEIISKINKIIDDIKPQLIITHALIESHQDHINTSRAVVAASRYQKNIWQFEPLYPSKLHYVGFRPIVYVDISATLKDKIRAIKQHKSQIKTHPFWIKYSTSLATVRGIELGVKYAECFEPIKMNYGD